MNREVIKRGGAVGTAALLLTLVFFVLAPPTTAVYLDPGTPDDASVTKGTPITFEDVNLTIRGPERIPVDSLTFTIYTSGGQYVTHVEFYINGTELSDPDGRFTVTPVTDVSNLLNSSGGSSYGFNEYNGTNKTGFGHGYGPMDPSASDLTILYEIVYNSNYTGNFYARLYVNAETYTYQSPTTSFKVVESSGGGPGPGSPSTPKDPQADADGPYTGFVGIPIQFNGSGSKPADGRTLTSYSWDLGDGSTRTGAKPFYAYTSEGIYTVTLTVTDDQKDTDTDTTQATITMPKSKQASNQTREQIKEQYGIELDVPFYANDTDGDKIVDNFDDPNDELTDVRMVRINGNIVFLVSVDDNIIPEFYWDTESDTITPVEHQTTATSGELVVDENNETITLTVTVNKTDWIYIELLDPYPPDKYPEYALNIKTADNRTISPDMIWRENDKIYVLDDAATQYQLTYGYFILEPLFEPFVETVLTIGRPTFFITYHEVVQITAASFSRLGDITSKLQRVGTQTYSYKPPVNLTTGVYTLSITATDLDLNTLTSTAKYTVQLPIPQKEEQKEDGLPWIIILFAIIATIIIIISIITMLFRFGYLYLEEIPPKYRTTKKPPEKITEKE